MNAPAKKKKASKCAGCKECKIKNFSKPHPSVKKMLSAAFVVCPCGKEILHQQMKSHVLNCETFGKSITSLLHSSSNSDTIKFPSMVDS